MGAAPHEPFVERVAGVPGAGRRRGLLRRARGTPTAVVTQTPDTPRTMPNPPKPPEPPKHDAAYKALFSRQETVADTLRAAARDLVRRLDLPTLERLPASFVTKVLGRRHADMLWQVRISAQAASSRRCCPSSFTTASGDGPRRPTSANSSPRCRASCLAICPSTDILSSIFGSAIPTGNRRRTCSS